MALPLTIILLVTASAIVLIAWFLVREARITGYFVNAVTVYAWLGDEDAKLAAIAAVKVATAKHRRWMVNYLYDFGNHLTRLTGWASEPELFERVLKPVSRLCTEMEQRDWVLKDIVEVKQRLGEANAGYLEALNRPDPRVFMREYPDLFRGSGWRDMIEAARKYDRRKTGASVHVLSAVKCERHSDSARASRRRQGSTGR